MLDKSSIPKWFTYPKEYLRIIDLKLTNIEPWFFLEGKQLEDRFSGLQTRYPGIQLVPFARRCDNDDVACWSVWGGNLKVYVIHDFSKDGWDRRTEFADFWSWYHQAINDMIEHSEPYR